MTNGDRIRQMSDEELAKLIPRHSQCPPKVLNCPYGTNCDLCWFNWLRMEATMKTDYISRDEILAKQKTLHEMQYGTGSRTLVDVPAVRVSDIEAIPAADVRPVKEGENITENNPVDEFVCSECGIIIEDWLRVEIDEDDGERTNYEYAFRFCPNCGAKMGGTP